MAKNNDDSKLPKLEYIIQKRDPLENIEIKKSGYILQDSVDRTLPIPLENNFYDEINNNKMKSWDKFTKLAKYNPFVPLGCLITMGVLFNGIVAMKNKDRGKSQRMMRYRVAAQGSTIIALVVGTIASSYFVRPNE